MPFQRDKYVLANTIPINIDTLLSLTLLLKLIKLIIILNRYILISTFRLARITIIRTFQLNKQLRAMR